MNKMVFSIDIRLIEFAASVIEIVSDLPKSTAGSHLCSQIVRSCTAPALQYGEAQSAESRNDFIHKMKIALKELRETFNALRLIKRLGWCQNQNIDQALDENNQLISIFVKSISTAQKNKTERKVM